MFEVTTNKTSSKSAAVNQSKTVQRKIDSSNPLAKIISNSDITSRIQKKLNVGQSGDKYEKEADKTAEEVTSKPAEVVQPSIQLKVENETGQKQPEEKEEPVQAKSESEEEKEEKKIQKQTEDNTEVEEPLQMQAEPEKKEEEKIQKQSEDNEREDEPAQMQPESEDELQAKDGNTNNADTEFERKLSSQKGKGSPLPDETKQFVEPRLRADFGSVRIHTGSTSVEMNKQLKSQAFTVGSDVFFNEGRFKPETNNGKKLVTHELTHVIQQGKAKRKEAGSISKPAESENEKSTVSDKSDNAKPGSNLQKETTGAPAGTMSPGSFTGETTATEKTSAKEKPGKPSGQDKVGGKQESVSAPGSGAATKNEPVNVEAGAGKQNAETKSISSEGNSEDVMKKFTNAKPSQIAVSYPSLGNTITNKLNREQKVTAESVPVIKAETGGVNEIQEPKGNEPGKETAEIDKGVTEPEPGKPEVKKQDNFTETPSNKQVDKELDKVDEGGFFSWFKNQFDSFVGNVKTTDPGVNTSAGKRPDMNLKGEADPNRIEKQKSEGQDKTSSKKAKTQSAIINNPGKENIQPVAVNETRKPDIKEKADVTVETEEDKGMNDYAELPYPPDMREAADNKLKPMTEKSLAAQREQVTAAAKKRDDDKTAEMKRAEEENAKLNKDAEKKQNDIVSRSRGDVEAKQKEGMKEAEDKLNEFDKEAADEQKSQNEKVNKRIKEDREKADKKLNDAEKEAQKEKEKGEKEAQRKKEELKKESENDSWWDRAVNAVKSAVKSITDAIDKVFDAVRKAVKTIIDAAKNAALAVIEAGRKWVVEQLDNFGKWIKDKVNKYIGSVFPGIAKRINAAIDAAVNKAKQAVNFVADQLKKGVEALANSITNAINNILDKFQTAMKAAVQIAGALLTGDFAEAIKIAFYAACEVAGIDPKPIIDFLNYAGETITIIYKDPLGFFMNVVKGVKKGLNQFLNNIKKHLLNGLIGWLTGAISEAGITLPEKFDLKGIFSLVMQILGLTYQNIRAKVVKKLGPKGEEIVSKLETAVSFIKELVTRGPIVIWEKVKEKLTNLKETVIGGIRDWVITTVIKEGIMWLISLLNPASAIAKALKLLYDFVMFLVERYQQIIDFVKSVFESVGALARGSLGKAANAVEGALGRSVPVIISFIASLLGLGGISKTIKKIIGKVRKPIDKALDKIIGWIVDKGKALLKKGKAFFEKGKEKIKELLRWWKVKKNFKTKSGESHSIFFKGKEKNAELYMASDNPRSIEEVLNDQEIEIDNREKLKSDFTAIQKDIKSKAAKPNQSENEKKSFHKDIEKRVTALANSLSDHLHLQGELPPTTVTHEMKNGKAYHVHAEPLTVNAGNTTGSAAGGSRTHVPGSNFVDKWENKAPQSHYRTINGKKTRVESSILTATHLLSHEFHGPFTKAWNVALTHTNLNIGMKNGPEQKGKDNFKKNKLKYDVRVKYFNETEPTEDEKAKAEADVEQVKKWIGFYIGSEFDVKVYKWNADKKDYNKKLFDGSIPGQLPPVRGQKLPDPKDEVFDILKQVDKSSSLIIRGTTYYKSIYNSEQLNNKYEGSIQNLSIGLAELKKEDKVVSKSGHGGGYFINSNFVG